MKSASPFAALALLAANLAITPALAAPRPVDAAQVEALCPGLGLTALRLGQPRERQDAALLGQLYNLPPTFAPFAEANLDFTGWSELLAAVSLHAASPDGAENTTWRDALELSLIEAGWREVHHLTLRSSFAMDSRMFEREFDTPTGKRTYLVEVDAPGALLLRCGDLALLEQAEREARGELTAGTPRPVLPPASPEEHPLPDPAICERPEVRSAFAETASPREIGPVAEKLFPGESAARRLARHGERLNQWLKWKLLASGAVPQDRLWEIEEQVAPVSRDDIEGMENSLIGMGATFTASKSGDGAGMCKGMIAVLASEEASNTRAATRWDKFNRALEVEGGKLGISLD